MRQEQQKEQTKSEKGKRSLQRERHPQFPRTDQAHTACRKGRAGGKEKRREKAKAVREARRKGDGDWTSKTEGAAQNRDETTREQRDWPKAAEEGGRKED